MGLNSRVMYYLTKEEVGVRGDSMAWLSDMHKNVIKAQIPFKVSTLPFHIGIVLSLDPL